MSFTEDDLGYFIPQEGTITQTKGAIKGSLSVKMDTHCLAYLLKGINCRIGVYEKMELGGPLPTDDEVSFNYTKRLRDAVKSARDSILEPES